MSEKLQAAIGALDAGDAGTLGTLLREDPDLVHARVEIDDQYPYEGYFARPQLLHHVAGNPVRGPVPQNIVALTQLILDAGAEVDAGCGGDGTTLGLVASSGQAAEKGVAPGLIDALVAAGADGNIGNGQVLYVAVYHTVECRQQREVAETIRAHGAEVDLCFAAALGKQELVDGFFAKDGSLTDEAYRLFRMDRMENPSREQILQEALTFACMNGRVAVASFLLDQGADANGWATVGKMKITPLHAACWAGWLDATRFLVERGADLNVCDPVHTTPPPGWATFCKRTEVVDYLRQLADRFDIANAVEYGCVERVEELLADRQPDEPLAGGRPGNLLRAAAWTGFVPVVRCLLERGADRTLANEQGKTALDVAAAEGHDDVVALLRS